MRKTEDWSRIYILIEQLERDLSQLKLALPPASKKRESARRKRRSLYGVFPQTRTILADFRDARASWTRKLDDL